MSNATQTTLNASGGYKQSYVIFNNSLYEFANKNIYFIVDGAVYANKTANSTGFVSFNYTGAWSSHAFEWKI